jgi:adenosylcobyric acid synthase
VWGCYIHGIFTNEQFRRGWLRALGWQERGSSMLADPYDRLADHVEAHISAPYLEELLALS